MISNFKNSKIVFAGFNALNQAEEKILQQLIAKDIASIYWDIDSVFLNDVAHDAGLFVRRFKNTWSHYKTNPFEWMWLRGNESCNLVPLYINFRDPESVIDVQAVPTKKR